MEHLFLIGLAMILLFVKNAFINFSTFSVSRETDSFGNEEFVLSFLSSNFF